MPSYKAIIPAAGASRRMGQEKLLLPFRGRALVEAPIEALLLGGVSEVVVVTRSEDRILQNLIHEIGGHPVVNRHPEHGMLSSILAGIGQLDLESDDAVLVCPGDLPLLHHSSVHRVIQQHRDHGSVLVVPTFRTRRGHPLLIGSKWVSRVESIDPSVGLRQLLLENPDRITEVPVGDLGILRDVDTPADYQGLPVV